MTNDFLMRQIEDIARALAGVLFMRNLEKHAIFDEEGQLNEENFLWYRLKGLVLQGHINEAENLLFESIEHEPADQTLVAAVDFYDLLAAMTDAELEAASFSRQEVYEGLAEVHRIYAALPVEDAPAGNTEKEL